MTTTVTERSSVQRSDGGNVATAPLDGE